MKQVKYVILFTIISFVYLSESIFANPVYLLPPDDANAAKVIEIIPECNGVSAGDEINLTAKTEPAETKVFWEISENYALNFYVKSTSDNTAKFHAGEYGGSVKEVPVRACPSNSYINCATVNIKVYECKKCSGGSITNKEDGTLPTDDTQCCVNGEIIQKNPIPDDKKLEDCPNREDNPKKGKDCNGCGPEWLENSDYFAGRGLYPRSKNDPMGDGGSSFLPACCKHDRCYGTCDIDYEQHKQKCDSVFHTNMVNICSQHYNASWQIWLRNDCKEFALGYYSLVKAADIFHIYKNAQKEGCNCCRENPAN